MAIPGPSGPPRRGVQGTYIAARIKGIPVAADGTGIIFFLLRTWNQTVTDMESSFLKDANDGTETG